MISQIIYGKIWHRRAAPSVHAFSYPACSFAIDLDELPALDKYFPLLGINRFGVYSIWERDYLGASASNLKEQFLKLGAEALNISAEAKVIFISMPKLFGYIFNPVTFYLVLDPSRRVQALAAEVRNTFGEAHLYFSKLVSTTELGTGTFRFAKEFYVSPFLEVDGYYDISVAPFSDKLDIHISLLQNDRVLFEARLWGPGKRFSALEILRTLATRPLAGVLTMTRIHYQALHLFFRKRAVIAEKPTQRHRCTFRSQPSWVHRLRLGILRAAARLKRSEKSK